jgi:hypothetical protein
MSKRGRPTKRRRFFQTVYPRFRKKSTSECLESTISSKRLPVSTFKDAVRLSPTDDYYLVTDSEGNIGNMRFLRPIPEPQVTEPELLALHEGTGMPADKNNACTPSTPSGELWSPT